MPESATIVRAVRCLTLQPLASPSLQPTGTETFFVPSVAVSCRQPSWLGLLPQRQAAVHVSHDCLLLCMLSFRTLDAAQALK